MKLLHRINQLLNGRLLEEVHILLKECEVCRYWQNGECTKYDAERFCRKLARGNCNEWQSTRADKFVHDRTRRTKVTLWTHALLCGGAERWMIDLASGLDKSKYCVCIAIDRIDAIDPQLLQQAQEEVEHVVFGRLGCNAVLNASDISLSWSGFPRSYAKHKVFCSHGCDHYTTALVSNYNQKNYNFTAVSEKAADPWRHIAKPKVLYNGSDPERVVPRRDIRSELGICESEILIGYISRIIPEKNPWVVAIAAQELRNRGFNARAMFVGTIDRCPKYDDCIYIERTEDVGSYLGAIDCFMLPSNSEAFSLAITEAWLAKKPVVATRVGAIEELESKYGQLVFEIKNSPTSAVLTAIYQGSEVVERAYQVASSLFSTDRMVKRWEEYFDGLVNS